MIVCILVCVYAEVGSVFGRLRQRWVAVLFSEILFWKLSICSASFSLVIVPPPTLFLSLAAHPQTMHPHPYEYTFTHTETLMSMMPILQASLPRGREQT